MIMHRQCPSAPKLLGLSLAALLNVGHARAQVPDRPGTLLFAITTADAAHTSYLFGTHHAFGESFLEGLPVVKEKLFSCEALIVETTVPANALINARTSTTDRTRYLGKADLAYVRELFAAGNVDLDRLTPPELHATLMRYHNMGVCGARQPADTASTLDGLFVALATGHGMALSGLESATEQLELLNKDVEGMPRNVHKRRLKAAVEHIRSGNTAGCNEVERYGSLDWDLRLGVPCGNALMLTDRNARWTPVLVKALSDHPTFVAVGMSHLMFECGLIEELRRQGYRVVPVPL
jgi:uncharacterized protein YbaP (TraB family)